jgi:hypothetical protein
MQITFKFLIRVSLTIFIFSLRANNFISSSRTGELCGNRIKGQWIGQDSGLGGVTIQNSLTALLLPLSSPSHWLTD